MGKERGMGWLIGVWDILFWHLLDVLGGIVVISVEQQVKTGYMGMASNAICIWFFRFAMGAGITASCARVTELPLPAGAFEARSFMRPRAEEERMGHQPLNSTVTRRRKEVSVIPAGG